jgi:hypothetical protein
LRLFLKPEISPPSRNQRCRIETHGCAQRRDAKRHKQRDHTVDPSGRPLLRKLAVASGIAVECRVGGSTLCPNAMRLLRIR